jgi:predicted amidohydrolase
MIIGVAQIESKENINQNVEHILHYIDKGSERRLDLLCFPECCLVGYSNILISGKRSFGDSAQLGNAIDRVHKRGVEKGMDVVIGSPLVKKDTMFNAAMVLLNNGKRFCYKKNYLTDEESQYFNQGTGILIFESKGLKFGILICRDQNYPLLAMRHKYRDIAGLFILAAHYYEPEEAERKRAKNSAFPIARAVENGFFVFKANAVGRNGSYVSLGGSLIVGPQGEVLAEADESGESILTHKLSAKQGK